MAAAIASMGSPACSHPAARRTFCTSVSRNGSVPSRTARMPSSASLCQGGQGVSMVVGRAGTGKTFALGIARHAWQLDGYRLLAAARPASPP